MQGQGKRFQRLWWHTHLLWKRAVLIFSVCVRRVSLYIYASHYGEPETSKEAFLLGRAKGIG